MKILSRNVNGIRSVVNKWFCDTIQLLNPDIIALQETKAFEHQCPQEVRDLWYDICRHAWSRPGYAWTAILTKLAHTRCSIFEQTMFHADGRITQIEFDDVIVINIYFPNWWTRADGTEMLGYKLKFYDSLMEYLMQYKHKKVIIIWDYNIAHTPKDIARPKENEHSIWFLPVERAKIWEFMSQYIDVYRYLYPDSIEYTRRSYRSGAKQNNVWRRIDYVCVSPNLLPHIRWFEHYQHISWSDHCPYMIEIDLWDK